MYFVALFPVTVGLDFWRPTDFSVFKSMQIVVVRHAAPKAGWVTSHCLFWSTQVNALAEIIGHLGGMPEEEVQRRHDLIADMRHIMTFPVSSEPGRKSCQVAISVQQRGSESESL